MLVVAWLGVMLSLPQLMQPGTAPGPGGLALPAVQAYVPDFLPGASKSGAGKGKGSKPAQPNPAGGSGSQLAAQFTSEAGRSNAGGLGSGDARSNVELISTESSRAGGPRPGVSTPPAAPATGTLEVVPAVVTNVVSIVPLAVVTPSPELAPAPAPPAPAPQSKLKKDSTKSEKGSKQAEKDAKPRKKESKKAQKDSDKAERTTQPVSRGKVVTA
jgi:hypothetical protein